MSFLSVLCNEFKSIFTNKLVVLVVCIGSMVYGLLYPMPYLSDTVNNQKLIIIDEDKSALSKKLIFLVGATPQVHLLAEVDSLQTAQNMIEEFQADGVLFIPSGFEASAKKGVGSVVSYMANASYFLIYSTIIEGVHNAINELSEELRKEKDSNLLSTDIIAVKAIPLYNTSIGYVNYALAAVLVFILHQTLIGGSGILTAYQNRIRKQNLEAYFNCVPSWKLVSARILAFGLVYCIWFLFYFGVLFPLFGVNIHASISDFWCFAFVFIICCASAGVMLGVFLEDETIPTQVVFVSSMPLVFVMGFIWPKELLPLFLQEFAELIPAYHGIRGFISLNQMGSDFSSIMPHFFALLGIFGFCFAVSVYVLERRRKSALQ